MAKASRRLQVALVEQRFSVTTTPLPPRRLLHQGGDVSDHKVVALSLPDRLDQGSLVKTAAALAAS